MIISHFVTQQDADLKGSTPHPFPSPTLAPPPEWSEVRTLASNAHPRRCYMEIYDFLLPLGIMKVAHRYVLIELKLNLC